MNNKIAFTVTVNQSIIDDHFSYNRLNIASNTKYAIMNAIADCYETYIKNMAISEDDLKYLEKEFSSVKLSMES